MQLFEINLDFSELRLQLQNFDDVLDCFVDRVAFKTRLEFVVV